MSTASTNSNNTADRKTAERYLTRRLPIVLISLGLVSVAGQAALLTVFQDESTSFLRGERFDLGSTFTVSSSSISLAGQDEPAQGTATSMVELSGNDPEASTVVHVAHWTYTVVLEEVTGSAVSGGNYAVDLYLSGEALDNVHFGTVYVTQQTSDPAVEGATITWDVGAGIPASPLFFVKVNKVQAGTPSGSTVTYTLVSTHDPVNGFRWIGVGGDIEGIVNPELTVKAGETLRIVYRHGNDATDDAPHNIRIKVDGTKVAEGPDVEDPGDEQVLEWTPDGPGAAVYSCKYHASTQAGTITVEEGAGGDVVAYTLESTYHAVNGFQWIGVGGEIDGVTNPALTVGVGQTLRIVYRHGSDAGDDAPHNIRIKVDGTKVAEGPDVEDPGDEQVVEWTPTTAGNAEYSCKYHASTQAGTVAVSE